MAIKLEQKTSQKLSPSAIQLVSMIQMSCAELCSYIDSIAQENPVFELEPIREHSTDFSAPRRSSLSIGSDDDPAELIPQELIGFESLKQDICAQIESLKPNKNLLKNARFLANLLDDRGYIPRPDYEIAADLMGEQAADEALKLIQSLSPVGVGARDLSECLCLQLRRMQENTALAEKIAQEHLELMSKGHYLRLARLTNADPIAVQLACAQIRALDPKPGSKYDSGRCADYVIPDLFLESNGEISINAGRIPSLNISNYYKTLLETDCDPEVRDYLSVKFRQAEQLMSNIHRRNQTILQCAEAIVHSQSEFFSSRGTGSLVPLTQAQIAESLGLNESTVSRAISGKYIQCPFGAYSLDSFFGAGIGDPGHQTSACSVKERLRQIVAAEDSAAPLSDQDIADMFASEGVRISRRTVAKYRQQMNIPGTFARKK